MTLEGAIESLLKEKTGSTLRVRQMTPLAGGCIGKAQAVETEDGDRFLVKSHPHPPNGFFRCEMHGLQALAHCGIFRVPQVYGVGGYGTARFILMDYVETGPPPGDFFARFGRNLARLHTTARQDRFGFGEDNYLGNTIQPTGPPRDWVEFWRRHRLGHQLSLARHRGMTDSTMNRLGDRLLDRLEEFLGGEEHQPSLLHGDLWSGNYLCDRDGSPVLIDPAVYYGVGEAELAMCSLFGGFTPEFFQAYNEACPAQEGAQIRRDIYQLYHLLNHLNLFGEGYRSGCLSILRRYS